MLGTFQGVPGGDVGVARPEKEEVAFPRLAVAVLLEDFKNAGKLEDAVNLTGGARDDDVAAIPAGRANQILQGQDAGGIEMTRILETQDDDTQIVVDKSALNLGAEQFGGTARVLQDPFSSTSFWQGFTFPVCQARYDRFRRSM